MKWNNKWLPPLRGDGYDPTGGITVTDDDDWELTIMAEMSYFRAKDGDLVLSEEDDKWIVAFYDRSDILVWEEEFLDKDEAVRRYNRAKLEANHEE